MTERPEQPPDYDWWPEEKKKPLSFAGRVDQKKYTLMSEKPNAPTAMLRELTKEELLRLKQALELQLESVSRELRGRIEAGSFAGRGGR